LGKISNSTNAGGGIGISGVIGIVFVVLKLLKVIDWKWLWVLAPFWIPFTLASGIFLIILLWWWIWSKS
jgi:hypothetical protein